MVHQHLAVAPRAGADADGGYRNGLGDRPGDPVRDGFEHDGEAAGVGEGHGVVDNSGSGLGLLALHLEPAQGVDGLRGETDVAHDGHLGVDDGLDHVDALAATLELHGLGTSADQHRGVPHRVLDGRVVAHPRHVADDQRPGLGPRHGTDVVRHVVDGDLQRVVIAEDDHGHAVPDENDVDARLVGDAGSRRVIRRHHHERRTAPFAGAYRGRGHRVGRHAASFPSSAPWLPAVVVIVPRI